MVNWDAEDVREFKKEAQTTQQEYCDLLGDREWDVIEVNSRSILRRKVGFGIFGPPPSIPTPENRETGYSKEQFDVLEKVCDQLVETLDFSNRNIHFACIFMVMKVFNDRYTVPLFKAKGEDESSSKCVFVDTGARKYSSWDDYLQNNTLQKCIYCYPTNGLYENNNSNEVCVSFGTSPACDVTSRVLSFLDTVSTVATVSATIVGVAALCTVPIAGPIMAASVAAGVSTGAYGVTRSSYVLYDRATHSQSIGLSDAEARGCWLSIVGSSLGFAQGRMIASMTNAARAGEVMGKAGRIAFLIVQTGSLTVNGIGIVHGLAILIDKSERNELTPLDVFQFSASVLFFTNSAINCKTASTIIKEVQHDVINSHREGLSKDAKKLFNKQTGKLRGRDEMYGNAKVVKQLNRIENSQELYEMMVKKDVSTRKVKLTEKGFKGQLVVNKNLKIHPLKLLEIPAESRKAIFNSTRNYSNGTLTKDQFHKDMKVYCRKHQIAFESMRKETTQKLCQMYGKENLNDIVVGGKKIFANATPHEIDRLRVVLENTAKNNQEILQMTTEFAASSGCTTTKDFIIYTEYFVADLNETVNSYEARYQQDLTAAKTQPDFKQSKFDEDRGIGQGMKRKEFHRQKAMNQFKTEEDYARLKERYNSLKSKVAPLNQKCKPGFFSDDAATYHHLKHKHFGTSGNLTEEQYFEIAQEVVGNPTNKKNSMLSQDGSCVMITYIEPERGVRAIKIDRDGNSGIATVMYDPKLLPNKC
ncbi:hypothetical protein J6590_057688 [Homalodisca vitripennis]|nr:hypothetical protein J6590_057688 [Homalodisca vitripennis]